MFRKSSRKSQTAESKCLTQLRWDKWLQSINTISQESHFSSTLAMRFTSSYTRDTSCLQQRTRSFPNNAVGPFRSSNDVAGSHIDWRSLSTGRFTMYFPLHTSSQPLGRRILSTGLDPITRILYTWKGILRTSNHGKLKELLTSKSRLLDGFDIWYGGRVTVPKTTSGSHSENCRTPRKPFRITKPSKDLRSSIERLRKRNRRVRHFLGVGEDLGSLDFPPTTILGRQNIVIRRSVLQCYSEWYSLLVRAATKYYDLSLRDPSSFTTTNTLQQSRTSNRFSQQGGIVSVPHIYFASHNLNRFFKSRNTIGKQHCQSDATVTAPTPGYTTTGRKPFRMPSVSHDPTFEMSTMGNLDLPGRNSASQGDQEDSKTGPQYSFDGTNDSKSKDTPPGAAMKSKNLPYAFPLNPSGGRKKRMDKAIWKSIETLPIFDPDSDEINWTLLFGKNTEGIYHPDLEYADQQWSDAAAGTGLIAIRAGKVTFAEAAVFHSVFTAEGDLLKMRKHVGAPFLGPDNRPLIVSDVPMCGDEKEWKEKSSAYTIDDVEAAPNYSAWVNKVLATEPKSSAVETDELPEQSESEQESLSMTLYSKEIQKDLEKENRRLERETWRIKGKMGNLLLEHKEAISRATKLDRHNSLLKKFTGILQRQRVTELEKQASRLVEDVKRLGNAVSEQNPGDGIAILERLEVALAKGLEEIKAEKENLKRKPINIDEDSDSASEDLEDPEDDDDIPGSSEKKRRSDSPASITGSASRKAAKQIQGASPGHSRQVSLQEASDVERFLNTDMTATEFLRSPEPLQKPPPLTVRDYMRVNGNPADSLRHPVADVEVGENSDSAPILRKARAKRSSKQKRGKKQGQRNHSSIPSKGSNPKKFSQAHLQNSAGQSGFERGDDDSNPRKSKAVQFKAENINAARTLAGDMSLDEDAAHFDEDGSEMSQTARRFLSRNKAKAGADIQAAREEFDKGFTKSLRWNSAEEQYEMIFEKGGQQIETRLAKADEIPPDGTPNWPPAEGTAFTVQKEIPAPADKPQDEDDEDWTLPRYAKHFAEEMYSATFDSECVKSLQLGEDNQWYTVFEKDGEIMDCALATEFPTENWPPKGDRYDFPPTTRATDSDEDDDRDADGVNRFSVDLNPDTQKYEATWWTRGQFFSRKATRQEIRDRDRVQPASDEEREPTPDNFGPGSPRSPSPSNSEKSPRVPAGLRLNSYRQSDLDQH
ncbi:hypothetical protein N431DRAFT_3409 [Stipitochalara longipes BDJ]|nr:hypothetical protein N431DRAFT_3409 [Stipitochalara longipes BDJ]